MPEIPVKAVQAAGARIARGIADDADHNHGSDIDYVLSVSREALEAAEPHRAEQLKQRAEQAENALVRCVIAIKIAMDLTGRQPPNPSEWERGYWACVNLATAAIGAPYVDMAMELTRQRRGEADARIASYTFPKETP